MPWPNSTDWNTTRPEILAREPKSFVEPKARPRILRYAAVWTSSGLCNNGSIRPVTTKICSCEWQADGRWGRIVVKGVPYWTFVITD